VSALPSLEDVFEPRRNGLNVVRLALALGVVLWHSISMAGAGLPWQPAERLLLSGLVDGFFAVSGFLIVRSWLSDEDPVRFLSARALRIMPGFWVCLLVVAFALSPLYLALTGRGVDATALEDGASYVGHNALLWIFQEGIAGMPAGGASGDDGVWNGSLWTLSWEFVCYLGVLVLGVTGLLRRRWVLPALFLLVLAVLAAALLPALDQVYLVKHAARFGLMFLAGALLHQFRHRVPVHGALVAVTAAAVVLSAALVPADYRLVGALPLAYVVVVGGALLKHRLAQVRHDLSYGTYIYAYPVQQVVIGTVPGVRPLALFALSVAGTLPLAAASWWGVERPAQRLGRRWLPARRSVDERPAPAADDEQRVKIGQTMPEPDVLR